MSDIIFNISGGNNQILPNATEAVQNFYGDQFAEAALQHTADSTASEYSDEAEQQLCLYISDKVRAREYISQLRQCRQASEAGGIVATMVDRGDITKEQAVKQAFIEKLVPFLTGMTKGTGIDNLRTQINNALLDHKDLLRTRRNL